MLDWMCKKLDLEEESRKTTIAVAHKIRDLAQNIRSLADVLETSTRVEDFQAGVSQTKSFEWNAISRREKVVESVLVQTIEYIPEI
jgi:hypothetical protein